MPKKTTLFVAGTLTLLAVGLLVGLCIMYSDERQASAETAAPRAAAAVEKETLEVERLRLCAASERLREFGEKVYADPNFGAQVDGLLDVEHILRCPKPKLPGKVSAMRAYGWALYAAGRVLLEEDMASRERAPATQDIRDLRSLAEAVDVVSVSVSAWAEHLEAGHGW